MFTYLQASAESTSFRRIFWRICLPIFFSDIRAIPVWIAVRGQLLGEWRNRLWSKKKKRNLMMNFKSKKRATTDCSPNHKKLKLEKWRNQKEITRHFTELSSDDLEAVAKFLDTKTCLSILRTCKTIFYKLYRSPGFWKHLCYNENFHEYTAMK